MYTIPTKTDGTEWYEIDITLEDVDTTLEFNWNHRLECWLMNVTTSTGTISGIRLVPTCPLLHAGTLPGQLWMTGSEPSTTTLGTSSILYYVTAEEVADLEVAGV